MENKNKEAETREVGLMEVKELVAGAKRIAERYAKGEFAGMTVCHWHDHGPRNMDILKLDPKIKKICAGFSKTITQSLPSK